MPVAVITPEDHKFELKTLDGAYVTLRRLSYGEWLHRQEIAVKMTITDGAKTNGDVGNISMMNKAVTEWEFKSCIVDHNLQNADETPLDFRQPSTLGLLNPKVGNEIAEYIKQLHDFEAQIPN